CENERTVKLTDRRLSWDQSGYIRLPPWLSRAGRRGRHRQRAFRFLELSERLIVRFKLAILLVTGLMLFTAVATTASGRHSSAWLLTRSRWSMLQLLGIPPKREEIDADWERRRKYDIEQTRGKLRSTYAEYGPSMRGLLDYAGLDPDHALLRWGNFD